MTIKDIARESGYSTGTVSRVLNGSGPVSEQAAARIREVVEKYSFQLNTNAKFLKQQTPEGIAVIIRGTENLLFAALVERLQNSVEAAGFNASMHYIDESDDEVKEAMEICQRQTPQGIFFLGSSRRNFQNGFHRIKVPCVMVTNSADGLGYTNLGSVSTNDTQAAQFAVQHLIALGHRKIAVLGGEMDRSQAALSRYVGAQYAFFDNNVPFDPSLSYQQGKFSIEEGYSGMMQLLDRIPDLEAVFVMADVMAIGALRAIEDRGLRVPEDISLISFDGISLVRYTVPRIATVCQDLEELTQESVSMMLNMIEDGIPGSYRETSFTVFEGESIKPANLKSE